VLSCGVALIACTALERPRAAEESDQPGLDAGRDSGPRARKDARVNTPGEVGGEATGHGDQGEAADPADANQPTPPSTPSTGGDPSKKPDAGAGSPKLLPLGSACTRVVECASDKCQDGVCCESQNCGACKQCDATGHCAKVVGRDDKDTCHGEQTCDANGTCVGMLGVQCTSNAECVSGACNNGICCEKQCAVCSTCGYTRERNETNKGKCLLLDGDDKSACGGTQSCVRGTCAAIDSQSLPQRFGRYFAVSGFPDRVGQTFTVSRAGLLVGVRMDFTCWADTEHVTAWLESVAADGTPTGTRVADLSESPNVDVPGYLLQQMPSFPLVKPLSVAAGTRLAIVAASSGATMNCLVQGGDTDNYAGGEAFQITAGEVRLSSSFGAGQSFENCFQVLISH
jgi:hypothetical protein